MISNFRPSSTSARSLVRFCADLSVAHRNARRSARRLYSAGMIASLIDRPGWMTVGSGAARGSLSFLSPDEICPVRWLRPIDDEDQ